MNTIFTQIGHPEPIKILVGGAPVKEGVKLSENITKSWEDLRGLSWILVEDWS